uniref:Homeobox domain-containing protein n=1 Tax=Lotus japonicus TaxID=34305 RepID=I3T4T9_LOTJA|nr:unknown [Lotus japonicus]
MSATVQCLSCARFLAGGQSLPLQRKPLFSSVVISSRPRNLSSSIVAAASRKKKNKSQNQGKEGEEDAVELLFKLLEEDLKNDDLSIDDDDDGSFDDIPEEELAFLESVFADALGDDDDDDGDAELLNSDAIDVETGDDEEAGDDPENDNEDGDESPLKLRTWQMKKLARALRTGRRKTSIKSLAAELCLDRALVLELLRNPPPNLLMMSLSVPDEPPATVVESKLGETIINETSLDSGESEPKAQVPIHTMQRSWSAQKRLKKAHVDTLERVYRRSKRPTNTMISSIVHVTNIPRRKVVKWFEDKRAEDGVPDRRLPYQRSTAEETA